MDAYFYIPEKLSTNSIYSGIHWAQRKKHKDLFRSVPFVCPKVKKFPVRVTYDFKFRGRLLDASNCTYMMKLIEDNLIHKGVIKDDCPKYVSGIEIRSSKGDDDVCIISFDYQSD